MLAREKTQAIHCRKENVICMYYVYMIRCEDNTIYTGITTDLDRRLNEHKKKAKKCAKYTCFHDAVSIEVAWICENRSMASKLEYYIKRLTKKEKEQLIVNDTKLSDIVIMIDDKDYIRIDTILFGIEKFDNA